MSNDLNILKITKPDGSVHFAPSVSRSQHEKEEAIKPQALKNRYELISEEKMNDMIAKNELFETPLVVSGDSISKANNAINAQNQTIAEQEEEISSAKIRMKELEARLAALEKPVEEVKVEEVKTEAKPVTTPKSK